jgi:UDP-GlcNAc:undecaprenyl-phosphate GlcNAc-1-phosphate transferase
MYAIPFVSSLVLSLLLVPLIRRVSIRLGRVALPRDDRWHRKPTATLGGVAIYVATLAGILISAYINQSWDTALTGLLVASSLMFFLGLYDDFRRITPPAKLIGQILAASIAIYFGYTTNFFSARLSDTLLAQIPDYALTLVWLVGITNAINLLDNMDGLAGGIALITAIIVSFFFYQSNDTGLLVISLTLAGAVLGFLVFNFPPASIFMGDSGSLFLGFTLAVLAIARQPQASNVFAIMGVPTLIFMLPILDTTLVTITRILRGQSPAQGGRDHTSHRLIAFGLTERQAVLVLYGVALVSGVVALGVETLDYWLSLILVPVLVLLLALLTAYLGRMKVVVSAPGATGGRFTRLMVELTYRRRLLEISLDLILIGITYYLAFLTYYRFSLSEANLELFLASLPIAYLASYLSFGVFGVYRGVWRYVGIQELFQYLRATIGSVLIVVAVVALLASFEAYPPAIFLLFAIYLFFGLAMTRSSFKMLDQAQARQNREAEMRILIYGAGDAGEMAARWISMNPQLGYRAIGFLDQDPYLIGRQIHGINILGDVSMLESILERKKIDGVVIAGDASNADSSVKKLIVVCRESGRWVRTLRMDFEPVSELELIEEE